MQTKKGAIELSMTTIIVIVIGVTLLILGLVFVRGIFEKVTLITDEAFRSADKEIQERMDTNDKIYVSGINFKIESGKANVFSVGVQNFGEETTASTFRIDKRTSGDSDKLQFTLPDPFSLEPGEKKGLPIEIRLPKGAPPGKSYPVTIVVYKESKEYASQSIIISVTEE